MRLHPLLLASLLLATACSKKDPTPARADVPRVEQDAPKADAEQALAFAAPRGDAQVDQILRATQTAVQHNPTKTDLWIVLGRAWVRKARESADPGYYVHAEACATLALRQDPDNRLALDLRAMVLLNDHKFAQARELAEKVVAMRADDPTAYGVLGDALLELGDVSRAADAVQTMVDLKPNLPSYSRASYLRWLTGDGAAAKAFAREAIDSGGGARDPEPLAWVFVQAAMLFWHEGDLDGADVGFDRALGTFSEFPPALVGKGRVAMARGDANRAAELFGRAYKASPLAETAWLLGDARAAGGDAAGAAEAYAKVEVEGRRSDGRTLALFLATKGKDAEEALRLAQAELAVRGDLYTQDALAWALYRAGRPSDARRASDRALAHGTRDARLLYHAGAIRIAAGDVAGGKKLVVEALQLNPHFDWTGAREAEALMGGPVTASR